VFVYKCICYSGFSSIHISAVVRGTPPYHRISVVLVETREVGVFFVFFLPAIDASRCLKTSTQDGGAWSTDKGCDKKLDHTPRAGDCVLNSFSCSSHLEHRAPFGVSVITHILKIHGRLLWTSDHPVAEASTYKGQHNI
jgi:hypothetical protein